MFVNFSNHPMERWCSEQLEAASKYGELEEVAFPVVPSMETEEGIAQIASECVKKIMQKKPDVVMCQGEFTVTFEVVRRLQKEGVICVSACAERKTIESVQENGSIKKESIFEFCKFRKYAFLW